jgi:cell division protein FtsB
LWERVSSVPSELRDVRKAARRRAALRRTGPAGRPPRTRLTGRAGILALALCAGLVSVAYPLQQYLAQRSQLNALDAKNAATAQQVAKLQSQLSDWKDPDYVMLQARAQLHYVLPGQIGFTLPNSTILQEPIGIPSPTGQPWYQNLWSTVKTPQASPTPTASPNATPTSTISQ